MQHKLIHEIPISTLSFSPSLQSLLMGLMDETISLPNKSKDIVIIDVITKIQKTNPNLSIIPYYSLKFHQSKTLNETTQEFVSFLERLTSLDISEVLLVSGVPRPKHDSLSILKNTTSYYNNTYPRIAVAYNPFLQGEELDQENSRLYQKLKTGIVSSVYLQIGIDTNSIRQAIDHIRSFSPNLRIYLSVMNPSPSQLARFRYRPWKGVFLPLEYISSPQQAQHINTQLYLLAEELNIGIIQGQ